MSLILRKDCADCSKLPEGEVVAGHSHPVLSPLSEYDYNAHRDATTLVAIKRLYKLFGESADLLVFDSKTTPEQMEACHAQVAQSMLEILIECKVPDVDMRFLIESFQASMHQLFSVVARQKHEIEKEFLARTIGAKNPGMPKQYSREYATLGDLFAAVVKIRNEQDPDGTNESYFNIVKKG